MGAAGDKRTAWIVWVDIVRFSEREGGPQRSVMDLLTQHLLNHPLLHRDKPEECYYLTSTGDGYVLGCFEHAYPEPSAIIAFATDVAATRWIVDGGSPFEVRVALNYGEIRVPAGGVPFAVGHAFNWARRLCDACAPSQVVASAELVRAARAVDPATGSRWSAPETLEAKHGREIAFSVLRDPRLSAALSPRRAQSLLAGERAAFVLEALADGLSGQVRPCSVRLTLWILDGDGRLRSVSPRVVAPVGDGASTRPGATKYRVDSVVEGPVGEAFVHGRVAARSSLPDPNDDVLGYGAALFGPSPDPTAGDVAVRVRAMSRRPKSILAVPLQILSAPAGVLCVDFGEDISEERLTALGEEMFHSAGPLLAALLHLRGLVG